MSADLARPAPLEVWGGVECTVNRVGNCWFDQMAWAGHDRRLDDLDRFASLNISAIRYPVLWERTAPRRVDECDWRWSDERLARLRDLGVRPIVGLLHHGSGPSYTSLLDDNFPISLARFAAAVARRYPWVTDYTPVNEPLTTARFSGLYGHWYPHGRCDRDYVRALLNQLKGTVLAMRAIREVTPDARLIQTEDCGRTFGTRATRAQVAHEEDRRWLTWDLLAGRVDDRHPLHRFLTGAGMTCEDERFFLTQPVPPAVLGLNYYVTSDRYLDEHTQRYPPSVHGGNGLVRYADVEAVRARPRGIAGHEWHLMSAWRRYGIPVAITEVHLGCTREEQLRWLMEAWDGARAARARGADVRAVTAWGLLGSYNWHTLVTRDEGHYEPGAFDVRAATPRPTALASAIRCISRGAAPAHPLLATSGWWRRSTRLLRRSARRSSLLPEVPRLLIVGSRGMLGRAFERLCRERGIGCALVNERAADMTDPSSVASVMAQYAPWAVIDAGRAMPIDDAERHAETCFHLNVTRPVTLAAICARDDVPFVTFSSDLIFDGDQREPYVEDHSPRPLNVYGACKLEAERRVREIAPSALIIRTSAPFGPWNDRTYLGEMLHALNRGEAVHAPAEHLMSPTYVPDLVHAVLDLLIDGEHGVWHVANEGAVTWFELARDAARRTGRAAERIVPERTERVWARPAVRPRFSVLSSRRARLLRSLDAALDAFSREWMATQPESGRLACVSR
jgi:dTDP-4-dehydrorhamnose reductase